MEERVARRVRQTSSLNKYELMKDVKINHNDNDIKKIGEKKLLERNNKIFFGNVDKVTAYYDTDGWVREYKEGRKVQDSKLRNLKKQKDLDFGKTSSAFRALDNLHNLKETFYSAKLKNEKVHAKYYVSFPKSRGYKDHNLRILSATLPLKNTIMNVLEPEDDFNEFQIYDPIHIREQKEKLKRRKNMDDLFNPEIDTEIVTIEDLLNRRKEMANNVRKWEDKLPERLKYMKKQKIVEIRASVERYPHEPKAKHPSFHKTAFNFGDQDMPKQKSKGFFIKRQKTAVSNH